MASTKVNTLTEVKQTAFLLTDSYIKLTDSRQATTPCEVAA
jgi:kynureninase